MPALVATGASAMVISGAAACQRTTKLTAKQNSDRTSTKATRDVARLPISSATPPATQRSSPVLLNTVARLIRLPNSSAKFQLTARSVLTVTTCVAVSTATAIAATQPGST